MTSLLTMRLNQPENDIQLYETKRSEHEHLVDSLQLLVFTFLLILVVLTIWLFKYKKISFIHETGLALFYGLLKNVRAKIKTKVFSSFLFFINIPVFIFINIYVRVHALHENGSFDFKDL
jgi:hypothetical protein